MKTIVVTGGAGFIGSSFVELSLRKGYRVIVLDAFTYAGRMENLDHLKRFLTDEQLCIARGNICDGAYVTSVLEKFQPQAVFNFAAESHVDRSITGPEEFIKTNVLGTYQLLNATTQFLKTKNDTQKNLFRFVQISTDEVFGSLGKTGFFTEESQITPNSPYSASKAAGDHLAVAWNHTYGLPTVITHCSNNYGPRQFPEKLIPFMIKCALEGKPLGVYGDGSNIRDWIHVEDHCQGIWLAYEKGRLGQRYCFGGMAERNNVEVVHKIADLLDLYRPRADKTSYRTQIKFVKDRPGHDWRYAIDDQLSQKELGFTRLFSFDSGLESTVKWYLEHQDWVDSVSKGNAS
jgi:dTDP-glucose 4,6-dehydratase